MTLLTNWLNLISLATWIIKLRIYYLIYKISLATWIIKLRIYYLIYKICPIFVDALNLGFKVQKAFSHFAVEELKLELYSFSESNFSVIFPLRCMMNHK